MAVEFIHLSVENDGRRTDRKWAVEDITFNAKASEKTVVFGLPQSGKTTLVDTIRHPEKYPGRVNVRADVQELFLKDSHSWRSKDYAAKYDLTLRLGTFLIVDDAYDEAMPYLVRLDHGMLAFAGVAGHDCFHRFDRLLYLSDGRITFDGTPREFFAWVEQVRPPELEYEFDDWFIASRGETPGCPEVGE
jgi:energy-coupling factor transporter ATP-binding protein EcfA2